MISKGLIIASFCLAGTMTAGAVALPVAYFYNEQKQSLASEQKDENVLVDENKEVHLGTEDNPIFPGDSVTVDFNVEMAWGGTAKSKVYFDKFVGEGQSFLSVQVVTDDFSSPVQPIASWDKENPLAFKTEVKEKATFHFVYSLSRDLGSEVDSLSFSFVSHLRVEK